MPDFGHTIGDARKKRQVPFNDGSNIVDTDLPDGYEPPDPVSLLGTPETIEERTFSGEVITSALPQKFGILLHGDIVATRLIINLEDLIEARDTARSDAKRLTEGMRSIVNDWRRVGHPVEFDRNHMPCQTCGVLHRIELLLPEGERPTNPPGVRS